MTADVWFSALQSCLQPSVLLFLAIGVCIGTIIGALPGLSATMGIAIMTPITFWFAPSDGFAMLMGLWNAAIFAGGISAILVNTPGTPASICQAFDGYNLYRQGKGGLALGINVIYSFIGGVFSTFCLILFSMTPTAPFLFMGTAAYLGFSTAVIVSSLTMGSGLSGIFRYLALVFPQAVPYMAVFYVTAWWMEEEKKKMTAPAALALVLAAVLGAAAESFVNPWITAWITG